MASRQRSREQRWPLGTKIRKHFEAHGDFDGEVKGYNDGLYSIEYIDGDKEQFDEREMKRYVLKTPSFASPKPPPNQPPKEPSPKKKPAASENNKNDEDDADNDRGGVESPKDPTAAPAPDADNNDDDENERNQRMTQEIEAMHQEMDITGFVRGKTGQKRRKVN